MGVYEWVQQNKDSPEEAVPGTTPETFLDGKKFSEGKNLENLAVEFDQ